MTQSNQDLPLAEYFETRQVENQSTLQTLFQALATSHNTEEVEAIQDQISVLFGKERDQNKIK